MKLPWKKDEPEIVVPELTRAEWKLIAELAREARAAGAHDADRLDEIVYFVERRLEEEPVEDLAARYRRLAAETRDVIPTGLPEGMFAAAQRHQPHTNTVVRY